RGPLIWVLIALLVVFTSFRLLAGGGPQPIDTSTGMELLEGDTLEAVEINDGYQRVTLSLSEPLVVDDTEVGEVVQFYYASSQAEAVAEAVAAARADDRLPEGYNSIVPQPSIWASILPLLLTVLLLGGLFWFLMSRVQGGGSRMMNFGKSRAKQVTKEMPKVTFADVAGVDEAVEELGEIKEFLADPAKFQAVGAKIPKGVLLYGPPGTGKTLLARAVAGEAGAPFYSISGSDFVEMFVGVGASRVRDLFEQAKANTPAIIFVDEID